ncbi:MAG: HlyD family secretion protein [Candidatus Gastranaerophilales bacterium]|nr:HlyD family secretion protein [Candidatus Gastranaerophilales bacterium]
MTTAENKTNEIKEEPKKIKGVKRFITLVVGIIITCIAGYYIHDSLKYQITDDAYVEVHMVQVAPKVSGQIESVYIEDNQYINQGDTIAKIDDSDYRVKLAQAEANYQKALLNQNVARANMSATNSAISLAKKDLERYTKLYAAGAVSKQTLDTAQTKYDDAKAKLETADQALLSKSDKKVADAELKALKALCDQAALNLAYTTIKAPQSGTVTNKKLEKGAYVQIGQPLFALVPKEVWIIANYKENQVGQMKIGQSVDIKIDAYPDKVFKGKIDSIQRASGAKSSLFPPENAVGSFVKIVQRIPVKIVFTEKIDPAQYTIVSGMSVEPKVKIK